MKSRKLIYLLALIGLILVNSLYISYEFMIILIVVVAVGVFSFVMQKISVARAELYVLFNKDSIVLGDTIKVGMKLSNNFLLRTPWAQASVVIRCSEGEHEKGTVNLTGYDSSKRVGRADFYIKPQHAGVVYLHMNELEIRDYMHMFSTRMRYDYVRKAYVFPEIIRALSEGDGENNQEESSITSTYKRECDEVVDLRNYREGDAMNRIHWKLSSVQDEYIVKQYGEEADRRVYLCADLTLYDDETFRDDLDKIYQWVYSIAVRVIERGGTIGLLAWDGSMDSVYECGAADMETLDICMQGLMDIRCSRDALTKLDSVMDWSSREQQVQPIVVTNHDYESDIYRMVNVTEGHLQELLPDIC